jgi:DNA invertase Pin-like site-specific DNA recombinase
MFRRSTFGSAAARPTLDFVADACHRGEHDRSWSVLGGLAEFERELIRARTGEGRKRAKERGVKFGRPRKMTPHQRQEALQRLAAGETMADVARTYAVDATTIGRLAASSPFEQSAAAL